MYDEFLMQLRNDSVYDTHRRVVKRKIPIPCYSLHQRNKNLWNNYMENNFRSLDCHTIKCYIKKPCETYKMPQSKWHAK